jgi:hypothetical protein
MNGRIKHSAGCIIIDPETDKIILSRKISKYIIIAYIKKALIKTLGTEPEKALMKMKTWFTKGRIEKKHGIKSTALREWAEESWAEEKDIIIKKYLWSFFKPKRYGQKKIHMFLSTLGKKYDTLVPSDPRHRALWVDRQKVSDIFKSPEERAFRESEKVQEAIAEVFINDMNIDDLSLETAKNELEVDIGVER